MSDGQSARKLITWFEVRTQGVARAETQAARLSSTLQRVNEDIKVSATLSERVARRNLAARRARLSEQRAASRYEEDPTEINKEAADIAAANAAMTEAEAQRRNEVDKLADAQARNLRIQLLSGAALVAYGVAVGVFSQQAAAAAENQERLAITTERLALNVGISTRQLETQRQKLKEIGTTQSEANTILSAMAHANLDLAKSTAIVEAVQNIAAQTGVDYSAAIETVADSIRNASAESLKSMGVGESAERIFKKYAEAHELVASELSDTERRQAIVNYLLEQGQRYAGAYAAAADTLKNRQREFNLELEIFKTSFGDSVLPFLKDGIATFTRLIAAFNSLDPLVKNIINNLIFLTGTVAGLSGAFMIALPAVQAMTKALAALTTISVGAWTAILLVAAAFVALGKGIWDTAKKQVEESKGAIKNSIDDMVTEAERAANEIRRKFIEAQIAGIQKAIAAIEKVKQSYEAAAFAIKQQLFEIDQAMFQLQVRTLELDKQLWPLEDSLKLIEAQATLIIIPLQRQRRELQRQRDELEDILDKEEKRRKKNIEAIESQIDKIRELLALDKERLEFIDHELFIEDLRNRILRRQTSARALQLRSERMAQQDIVERRQQELEAAQDALKLEKERLEAFQEVANAQIEALDAQIKSLDKLIEAEQERVTYAREELELAKARQASERLAIEQQQRALEEQRMFAQNSLALINNAIDKLNFEQDALEGRLAALNAELAAFEANPIIIPVQLGTTGPEGEKATPVEIIDKIFDNLEQAFKNLLLGPDRPEESAGWGVADTFMAAFERYFASDVFRERLSALAFILPGGITALALGWIGEHWEEIKTIGSNILDAIKEWIDTTGRDIVRVIGEDIPRWLSEDALAWVTNNWTLLTQFLADFVDDLDLWTDTEGKPILDKMGDDIARWIQEAAQAWVDLGENLEKLKKIGKDILGGVWDGLKSKWNDVKEWINQKLSNIPDTFKEALNMGSPSKVMIPIGENIMAGVAVGLTKGLNDIRDRIKNEMSNSLMDYSTTKAITGVRRQSPVVNNYYNTAGPSVNVSANYGNMQSPSTVRNDLSLLLRML